MSLWSTFLTALDNGIAPASLPKKPTETWTPEYAVWRYLKARRDSSVATVDHAILLRQLLRWTGRADVPAPSLSANELRMWQSVGLSVGPNKSIQVRTYQPAWALPDGEVAPKLLDAPPQLAAIDESQKAEPWLEVLRGHSHWRSLAQKDAVWAVLNAPEGGTTLIALPTGAGKSLAFQAITRFSSGLTLVIVPTIALALDHYLNSVRLFEKLPYVEPRAYEATQAGDRSVHAALKDRTCRLLFASPEACVSGSLNRLLGEAADDGWLRTVVVDEAHVVETWGAEFRVDFQLLGNTLAEWKKRSAGTIRSVLLSATFSEDCRKTLREIFAPTGVDWREFGCQRLRPEMHYFVVAFSSDQARFNALVDALYHIPRPAIVYTTEVDDARELYEYATQRLQLRRVECFTGDTIQTERRRILESWRADELDLMIATSAFGMGVDKADVRAVVHACVPETVDRYYQEVGRGGRDGASTTCLFIPATSDWRTAKSLAPNLLGAEKVRLRWAAMWKERRPVPEVGPNVFDLPLNVRHEEMYGARSYGENVQWNKRLLLMLVRAARVRLLGSVRRGDVQVGEATADEWVRVELRFSSSDDVASLIADRRAAEVQQAEEAYGLLEKYVFAREPICRLLQRQYGIGTERACGSCPSCRRGEYHRVPCGPLETLEEVLTQPTVELVLGMPDFESMQHRDAAVLLLRRVHRTLNVRRFFCTAEGLQAVWQVFNDAFSEDGRELYRLDVFGLGQKFHVEAVDQVICIHTHGYSSTLESANRYGRFVTHWVPTGMVRRDANGRLPLISAGASMYNDATHWLNFALETRKRSVNSPA